MELLLGLFVFCLNVLCIFLLWNAFIFDIFNLPKIGYFDAMALYILTYYLGGRPFFRFVPKHGEDANTPIKG